jgi:putative cell wall-binding protein
LPRARSLRARAFHLLAAITLVAGVAAPAPAVRAATDRLPDLQMDPLSNFYTEFSGGQRRLRFKTVMTNFGTGPLEVLGQRASQSQGNMTTIQRIYDTAGGNRLVASRALMEYAEDGHDHWHIQGVMLYQLWSDDGNTRRGAKVGFCFLDSTRRGSTSGSVYRMVDCGTRGSTENRMGLSVGWGDDYPANFAFQWIDISTLAPGDYTVQARADEQNWYLESDETNNCAWARVRISATNGPVPVLAHGEGPCSFAPGSTARVERQYGDDRHQTAAAVSEDAFAPGVQVAYIATGANFPDALAAAAVAGAQGGPVILVRPDFLPALATTELERLNPHRIIVVGGPSVVSDYVLSLVSAYQTGGGITRISGPDRYATAAMLSSTAFAPGRPTVYIASGDNWPDALAAVPHASRAHGPVLLVRRDAIPDAVRAELQRLQPGRIVIAGGPSVVSDGVAAELDLYDTGGGVIRVAGPDRYATAAALSAFHHAGGAPFAYVATGENFPDALAAGSAAAIRGAPTILVQRQSIPYPSAFELDRLNPSRIYLLGGPGVIAMNVQHALAAYAQ